MYAPITGNTFPVKDELKKLGAKWDKDNKVWLVPADKVQEANQIVARGSTSPPGPKKEFRHYKCKECGAKPSRYVRIYRNGICNQCYRDFNDE